MKLLKTGKMSQPVKIKAFILSLVTFLVLGIFPAVQSAHSEIIGSDRRIDWEPGLLQEKAPYPVYANVKNSPYNASGDGLADDTSAIQNAINDAPPGSAVYLPDGTYRVTNQLNINKGIVLRGNGPDKTKILNYKNSTGNILRLGGNGSSSSVSITGGTTKGSNQITVSSTSGVSVGDYIRIYQDNDPSLVDNAGCNWCGDNGQHLMAQIVKIDAISANVLTLNRPLYYTFKAAQNPEFRKISMTVGVGIEDLFIQKVYSGGGYSDTNNILVRGVANSWIRNIESYNAVGAHVRMVNSYASEISNSFFHHGHSYGSGRAYGVFLFNRNSDVLVENNIFYFLRHSVVLESGGSGNVIAYNYSRRMFGDSDPVNTNWLMADLSTHGAHPYMNLFEGNTAQHIGPDYTWGSASHNTYFRNYIIRENEGVNGMATYHLNAVDVQTKNYYMNIVGNILCKDDSCSGSYDVGSSSSASAKGIYRLGYSYDGSSSQSDTNVENTLYRHGNFDFITDTTIWDTTNPDHNLPDSLYLLAKPVFFGSKSWPVYGPDLDPKVGVLPAEERFLLGYGEKPTPPVILSIEVSP